MNPIPNRLTIDRKSTPYILAAWIALATTLLGSLPALAQDPTGACCLSDFSCVTATEADCYPSYGGRTTERTETGAAGPIAPSGGWNRMIG